MKLALIYQFLLPRGTNYFDLLLPGTEEPIYIISGYPVKLSVETHISGSFLKVESITRTLDDTYKVDDDIWIG